VPLLGPADALPHRPHRILIGGTSGSGKSTLADELSTRLGLPYTEIDSLHHGPGWTVRPSFLHDVQVLSARPSWITEYQYSDARPILLARCDLAVYLLLPRSVVMRRVIGRTMRRSLRRQVLWNGNVEPPLRTFFTDPDHIIRWAWRTHSLGAARVADIRERFPDLPVVVLRGRAEIAQWVASLE